jgi:16S rRNA (adenine1518-N6/adenine1519-N6)-dimethyltransferase
VIDSHTHLDSCAPDDADLVAEAERQGVHRMLTVGTDPHSCQAALEAAERFPQVFAAIGRHPNSASGFDDNDLAEIEALAAHERCVAIGETGLDFFRDHAPHADQQRAFEAQIEARPHDGQAARHPHPRRAGADARDAARARGRRPGDHALLLDARARRRGRRAGLVGLLRRQRHLPEREGPRAVVERVPEDRLLVETDAPYLSPQGRAARSATSRRSSPTPPGSSPSGAGWRTRTSRRSSSAMPQPSSVGEPTQPSLRRLKAFGVRPKRDLGQNFLIDSNILGVIAAPRSWPPTTCAWRSAVASACSPSTWPSAAPTSTSSSSTGRSSPRCATRSTSTPNTTLHLADALALDLAALDPAPTKVVANLPYGIAATAILKTIEDLPGVTRWVAMVQKEVGERFAAQAGTGAYGVPSVLAQLACDVRVLRGVSRSVFHPVPNVDSVLVGLERTGPAADERTRRIVQGGFAHRRKALPRSLQTAGVAGRDEVRAALDGLGLPADVRAERLTPEQFRALAEALGAIPDGG